MPEKLPEPQAQKGAKSTSKWSLKMFLIYCLNLYICFLLAGIFILFGIRDKLALFPLKNQEWKAYLPEMEKKLDVKTRECSIKGPNKATISALLVTKSGSDYVYLVSHGNAGNLGNRIPLASYIISTGQSVFIYDYEGYGESSGEARLDKMIPDGLAAYDYLTGTLGYKPEQIILYGESIGCGVTTGIMKGRMARAVVLQSSFTSLIEAGKDKLWQLKMFPDAIFPQPHLDNMSAVKSAHPPLLFIHGDQDAILPVSYSRRMFEAALPPKEYYEIKGAGHNNIGETDLAGFRQALIGFMDGLVKKSPASQ